MSHTSNPYAQSGQWSGGSFWPQAGSMHSPTYGALPTSPIVTSPNVVTFQFNSSTSGSPLNASTVTDNTNMYFNVYTTIANGVRVTAFASPSEGSPFATVEWTDAKPVVTIKNRVPRQDATRWILLSHDRSTAALGVGPCFYFWTFQRGGAKLYKRSETNQSERLGKVYWSPTTHSLCLDLHVSLLQTPGNLEVFIVAAALIQAQVQL
ncbi:hypothetical protein D9611_012137 [Ephemerocybe angulata]|uniref:Uncharacterized protein n=1 Tax=Ephemerocybe angulata TaxID=980116 RepID=A0A8H5FG28_9AGAR|nr:hypothetical protein D9611_012137 [Tulosesus angulatus]